MTDRPRSDQASDIDELWKKFKASGDAAIRESLIIHYSPLVKFVAGRVAAGLPRSVDQNDLAVETSKMIAEERPHHGVSIGVISPPHHRPDRTG